MIISHKYKFIFIKTRKTAGTSIEAFLSSCCGDRDVFTPVLPPVDGHSPRNYKEFFNSSEWCSSGISRTWYERARRFVSRQKFYNHIPASDVQASVPRDVWNSYYKFCVERNPWDKTLSYYYMLRDRSGQEISLDEYLIEGDFCSDFEKYADVSGELLVDRIVRYESLAEELRDIFSDLGIPFNGELGVRAKSGSRPPSKKSYQDIYTAEQAAIVGRAFRREVELLNYKY